MRYGINRLAFSVERAYRYHVTDEAGELIFEARRVSPWLPFPTRRVVFFSPEGQPVAEIEPPLMGLWRRGTTYTLRRMAARPEAGDEFPAEEEMSLEEAALALEAVVQAQEEMTPGEVLGTVEVVWTVLDQVLLHAPRYRVRIGEHVYLAQGSRYGHTFYEIMDARGEVVGRVERPLMGANYLVEAEAGPLLEQPLLLPALVIILDMELEEDEVFVRSRRRRPRTRPMRKT